MKANILKIKKMKTKFLTLLVLTTMTFVSAQNVNIPDLNFKIALLTHTAPKIDTNNDNEISVAEAEAYTGNIVVANKNISNLTGIEAFVNITGLFCQNNKLSSLDLSNNTALTQLHCYDNLLSSLDLSNNTALTQLHCYDNLLSSLNVSNSTALTQLQCYNNQLNILDVSNNTALTLFRCYNNQLSSLDLSNNTALTQLHCYDNLLSSLEISNNTNLKDLRCQNNQLTSLNLKNGNNTKFKVNNSVYLDLKNNPNLRCIQVDNVSYSNSNWSNKKDATACFSENCVTPTFNIPTSVCQNATAPALPTISSNTILGSWFPATIDTSVAGTQTYTFIPTCANHYSIDITVTVAPAPPTGAPIQYFNPGQTLADLVVNGGNLVWYSDIALTVNLPATTMLVNGITYYAIRQVGACKSSAFGVMVSDCANLNVPTPIGEENQFFVTGQTLAVLNVNGDNLVWYSDNTYSDALSLTEPLVHGATYYVVNEIGYCRSEALAITVQDLLNRSNFDVFGFSYYPNPTNDILTFSSNQPIDNVVVSNMLGQEVKVNLSSDKTSLDMSNLASGNYLVKVTIEGVSKTIKVVKL